MTERSESVSADENELAGPLAAFRVISGETRSFFGFDVESLDGDDPTAFSVAEETELLAGGLDGASSNVEASCVLASMFDGVVNELLDTVLGAAPLLVTWDVVGGGAVNVRGFSVVVGGGEVMAGDKVVGSLGTVETASTGNRLGDSKSSDRARTATPGSGSGFEDSFGRSTPFGVFFEAKFRGFFVVSGGI